MPTIDEAIEELGDLGKVGLHNIDTRKKEALKLGIEALKVVKNYRQFDPKFSKRLLLGETEE